MNLVHLFVRGAMAVRIHHFNFLSYTNENDLFFCRTVHAAVLAAIQYISIVFRGL